MNILITGARGQLGRELLDCFQSGRTVLGTPTVLSEQNTVFGTDIDELDIADMAALRRYAEDKRIDVIINCAAYTDVNGCESHYETALRANAYGPRNLAILSREIGAKLLHVSTDYVFPGNGRTPYVEWDAPAPESAYGKSKLLGEDYVCRTAERYFILRTAWLYSKYGNNFVKTIMRIAKEKGECHVVSDQRGTPTNGAELAHHILKLITTEEYGIYHATGNGECSWFDFAQSIVRLSGLDAKVFPCRSSEFPTPAKRPAYSVLDNLALRTTVGDDFRPWEEALSDFFGRFDPLSEA